MSLAAVQVSSYEAKDLNSLKWLEGQEGAGHEKSKTSANSN